MVATGSTLEEIVEQLLDPNRRVPWKELIESGLHHTMALRHFQALEPEIPKLAGWKKLSDFVHGPLSDAYPAEVHRNMRRTEAWRRTLAGHGLSDKRALRLLEGKEQRGISSLYLTRDATIIYYFRADDALHEDTLVIGTLSKVLKALEAQLKPLVFSRLFVDVIASFPRVLEDSNAAREEQIAQHNKLRERLLTQLDSFSP